LIVLSVPGGGAKALDVDATSVAPSDVLMPKEVVMGSLELSIVVVPMLALPAVSAGLMVLVLVLASLYIASSISSTLPVVLASTVPVVVLPSTLPVVVSWRVLEGLLAPVVVMAVLLSMAVDGSQ
jgi:hypothetical protein